jgi:acetyl-CoA carboxylase biotin carboxyl carrier protein
VAEDAVQTAGPFDVTTVNALIKLMARYDLNEIDLQQGDQRIRLRRGPRKLVSVPGATFAPTAPAAAAPAAASAAAPKAQPAAPAKALHEIKSELVGTFYASREPGVEPFVGVGTRVKKGDVLCLIEAMKLFNEIHAERDGVIVEVCVENQQPVEYGQVLFRLDPTA